MHRLQCRRKAATEPSSSKHYQHLLQNCEFFIFLDPNTITMYYFPGLGSSSWLPWTRHGRRPWTKETSVSSTLNRNPREQKTGKHRTGNTKRNKTQELQNARRALHLTLYTFTSGLKCHLSYLCITILLKWYYELGVSYLTQCFLHAHLPFHHFDFQQLL